MFAETFSAIVGPHVSLEPPLNEWVILFGAYLFFSFLAFGVARVLNHGIEKAELKEFNRHLGAIFGFLKGAVVCLVLTFFIATLPSLHNTILNSKSGRVAAIVMNKIHPVMPEKLHDSLEKYIHSLDDLDTGLPPAAEPGHAHEDEVDPWSTAVKDAVEAPTQSVTDLLWDVAKPSSGSTPPKSSIPGSAIPAKATGSSQVKSSIPSGVKVPPSAPTTPTVGAVAGDFLSEISGALGSDTRKTLTDTFQNLDPETRQQLESQVLDILQNSRSEDLPKIKQRLQQAGSDSLPGIISSLSRSVGTTTPATDATAQREQLLTDVSRLRSTFPQVQTKIQSELRGLMSGVPDQVAVRVLEDWKADLSKDGTLDPDTGTDADTTIEMRILRQMEFAGMRLDGLSRDLQDRLSSGADNGVELR
jgi:uncharacterized membrane protein required for colicin V production